MKKVYNLVASATMSLLTVGAFAQAITNTKLVKTAGRHLVKTSPMNKVARKPMGATTYAFIDYPVSDSVAAGNLFESYAVSPSIGQYYIQNFNMHYTMADTGADGADGQPVNLLTLQNCTVAFDTIVDAVSGNSYSGQNVVVDSLYIPMGQANASGKKDTLVVQITNVGAYGIPGKTVLWADTIIQDTGLSGIGNAWNQGTTLMLAPNLALGTATQFAVTMKYFDETKLDTCGFLYGFPEYSCAAAGQPYPDTTLMGDLINVGKDTNFRANSYTYGYEYFNGATLGATANKPLEVPNKQYGGYIYYGCGSAFSVGIEWQDIAMYAEVSFTNVTGVAAINNNGLSVGQNFPNPLNQTTQINYSVTKESDVVFSVNDITGREVMNSTYSRVTPGQHVVTINADQLASGIYFYTFNVNGNKVTKKMVINK